ncbi:MAG TPA: type III secretion system gatekeeper subunit SctW [Ramlibacter sp.]|jgi:type III secretion protein W|uniref:type III secretion system gatekeeper subunit SctW n=1 Tax=Ramlibacter sp. TaxID=1917967 RepID=UPI002D278F9B|nr:type III secretion system gatekeeper subunit SctW [Ramlibacter sp.]HZY20502.1 type III secretion system gatekeeper subunit SctW [Ramlibacter sp.]
MTRIEGNPFGGLSQGLGTSAGQAGGAPLSTGTFRGEQLQVKDELSVLADAAEEISLHHSEKAESKRHSERKVETDPHAQAMQIEQINAYLEAAKAFDDPGKLAELAKRMQESGANPRELARQQTGDPTQQYVLLQYGRHQGEAGGAPQEVLERIEDALADLEADHGPRIRAGLNTIGTAADWGHTGQDVADFQAAYRDVVLGDNTLSATLRLVLERLGGPAGGDFGRGLQALIQAIGTDLAAARPSADPTRLQALVQDLYQLEVVSTVVDGCRELARTVADRQPGAALHPFELMKNLVAVTGEKWVGASRFTAMADRAGLHDVGACIAFQTGVKNLLREMPPKVFPDADVRQSILGAAQDALDQAIDREEE